MLYNHFYVLANFKLTNPQKLQKRKKIKNIEFFLFFFCTIQIHILYLHLEV